MKNGVRIFFINIFLEAELAQLSIYFKYHSEIRRLIYTINSIENFNRQLRKVTKAKSIFPADDALFKSLYLAMIDATKV